MLYIKFHVSIKLRIMLKTTQPSYNYYTLLMYRVLVVVGLTLVKNPRAMPYYIMWDSCEIVGWFLTFFWARFKCSCCIWYFFVQILLLVGTKLELIIIEMAQEIQDRATVVKGAPVVEPSNKYFWFNRPQWPDSFLDTFYLVPGQHSTRSALLHMNW